MRVRGATIDSEAISADGSFSLKLLKWAVSDMRAEASFIGDREAVCSRRMRIRAYKEATLFETARTRLTKLLRHRCY